MGSYGSNAVVSTPSFSPDSTTLVFRECNKADGCGIGFVDLKSDARKFIYAPDEGVFKNPSFSPDGKLIVTSFFEDINQSQIVIMGADGKDMRKLTNGKGCRANPSFSPDGKKIIFSYSPLPETGSSKKCVDQDVFELDLASGKERQLTHFKFYMLRSLHYMPNGKDIIFHGKGPSVPIKHKEYVDKFGDNYIFIMSGVDDELSPAITGYPFSGAPSISMDGKIVFAAITNDMDNAKGKYNYDLFLRANGQDKRLTQLKSTIMYHAISPDGKLIAFLIDTKRDQVYELMIMNVNGSGLRSLGISGNLY